MFQRIGIFAKPKGKGIQETIQQLIALLATTNAQILVETQTAQYLNDYSHIRSAQQMQQQCDLIIVVGGDGSLLQAAQIALPHNIPIIGINRGRLGFLTDIAPQDMHLHLPPMLAGQYQQESRFLLSTTYTRQGKTEEALALNDVVLTPPAEIARMIEFETRVDNDFMLRQRADGLIIATPTGSTAYALSGGGPILHPALNAIVLVPMFPHTLSSRPIVLSGDSQIELKLLANDPPLFSWDGNTRVAIDPQSQLFIKKHPQSLVLLHPLHYRYFDVLRAKLNWG